MIQTIRGGAHAKGIGGSLTQITRPETPAAAEMDEAGEGLHDGMLALDCNTRIVDVIRC